METKELKFLHYGTQAIEQEEIEEVLSALTSDFLSQGPKIKELEALLVAQTGARYAVAVANGTAALHLAVKALDIPPGKEGLTTPITFVATANSLLYNGLKPTFADIEETSYCLGPAALEKAINKNTAVILPVHFAGLPCDMEALRRVAGTDVLIIEDASHALGSTFANGEPVGSCCYSDLTTFSFHPVKTITTGEGGAITTNNKDLYEKLLMLRNHGLTRETSLFKYHPTTFAAQEPTSINTAPWYYEMQELGFNYRLTDIQAALGIAQMKKLHRFVLRRRQIIETYNRAFANIPWLTPPPEKAGVFSALHLYVVKIDFASLGKSREQVMAELKSKRIGTQVHYIPVHLQPYYREHFGFKPGDFPYAEQYYQQCLSIPLYPGLTDSDCERVITAIRELKTH